MAFPQAFAAPVLLPSFPNRFSVAAVSEKSGSARCTAAPERTKVSKGSLPTQTYRLLPKNLPLSKRPPAAPRHNSVPFIGFFLELALGKFDDELGYWKKYGPIYFSNFLLAPIFYIRSYDATLEILNDSSNFVVKDRLPGLVDLFGEDAISCLLYTSDAADD